MAAVGGKELFLVTSVCVSPMKEQFMQFEQLILNPICLEPNFLQELDLLTASKLYLIQEKYLHLTLWSKIL